MKKILASIVVMVISGCTSYGWMPPDGLSKENIALDMQLCADKAHSKYPIKMQKIVAQPLTYYPERILCHDVIVKEASQCRQVKNKLICDLNDRKNQECKIIPEKVIPARYMDTDINEVMRKKDEKLCLNSKGYVWGKLD